MSGECSIGVSVSWSHDNQLSGKIMEDIVSVMLQESDYMVLPYGYEQTHPALCQKWGRGMNPSITLMRLRNSPDLLVYDNVENTTKIVEIKSHIQKSNKYWIDNKTIQNYNKFWNDCILVEIMPKEEIFYAEYIAKLASKNKPKDNTEVFIRENFRPFNKIFNIDPRIFEKYQKKTLLIMDALRKG